MTTRYTKTVAEIVLGGNTYYMPADKGPYLARDLAEARDYRPGEAVPEEYRLHRITQNPGNTVCWNNCGTTAEVAALVADVATVGVKKLPGKNPFPPGRLYRAFEIARGAAVLALGDDYEFLMGAERWLQPVPVGKF